MTDTETSGELLLEIGAEEIPAGYLMPALKALQAGLAQGLREHELAFGEINTGATPRRLAVSVQGLAARQPDRVEEAMGPPKKAAFDADGKPTKAALGFASTKGVSVDELQVVATPKGEYLQARVEQPGRATAEILNDLLPGLITGLPFPKSMRWGNGKTHFARPLRWLLAVYQGRSLAFSLEELSAGDHTWGHRFLAPQSIQATTFSTYRDQLRQYQVLVDPAERRQAMVAEINRAAAEAGGRILPDPELEETVTNLVEAPFAICGSFAERFLQLPREVLITSMREHQKYFAVVDEQDNLQPRFVAVNNTRVKDPAVGAEGHQRVLRARLEDAFFFFNEDQQRPLSQLAGRLNGIIFQHQLGTMADKTARLEQLAGRLADEFAPELSAAVRRAAQLCKADLLTSMVDEFPSLQGNIGRDYARRQGESEEVAEALYSHYLPLRAGGQLPQDRTGALLGIADRLDTLAGCFGIGLKVTGAADPFGLRRQAVGLIHLLLGHKLKLPLKPWIETALSLYDCQLQEQPAAARDRLLEFIKGRLANDLTGRGLPAEAVEAVLSVDFQEVNDCQARIEALVAVSSQPSFTLLAGSFKRVNNIIKDNRDDRIDPQLLQEPAEKELAAVLARVTAAAAPLLRDGAYRQTLEHILTMKEPIDRFFDQVMVMAEDEQLKRNRLALLTAIAALFRRVGDFSRMYALQK
ncbi:glycine--tRNA ligase subunit beta [Desulfurivibrio alkaliphilus]|uniref:Glycine--tRNA ligase beta subunit n=1 Tax=Desulfurivibrio alkaliphilus (strain DSM 19089 / UNIQEM U267 / AHT2) TaxID=589865 RepID=D6Z4C5_DESAT|nr:glycine--tRNA ligase subunit beta [Desulfurivibrio alkaliphilus]ADH86400.1 glycyl-tRNA synthetase, beta subunit [Desulfurivibrio alkaliphilus AHT 2]